MDKSNNALRQLAGSGGRRDNQPDYAYTIELSCEATISGAQVLGTGGLLLLCKNDLHADAKKCTIIFGAGGLGIGGYGVFMSKSENSMKKLGAHPRYEPFAVSGKVIKKGEARYDFCEDGTFMQVNYETHNLYNRREGLVSFVQSPAEQISGTWRQSGREIIFHRKKIKMAGKASVETISEKISEDWENALISDSLEFTWQKARDCTSF